MTPIAMTFLILAIVLVWGGLAVSTVALMRAGKTGDHRFGDAEATTPDRR